MTTDNKIFNIKLKHLLLYEDRQWTMEMHERVMEIYAHHSMNDENIKVANSHPLRSLRWDQGIRFFTRQIILRVLG